MSLTSLGFPRRAKAGGCCNGNTVSAQLDQLNQKPISAGYDLRATKLRDFPTSCRREIAIRDDTSGFPIRQSTLSSSQIYSCHGEHLIDDYEGRILDES